MKTTRTKDDFFIEFSEEDMRKMRVAHALRVSKYNELYGIPKDSVEKVEVHKNIADAPTDGTPIIVRIKDVGKQEVYGRWVEAYWGRGYRGIYKWLTSQGYLASDQIDRWILVPED